MKTLKIGFKPLSLEDVLDVARNHSKVVLDPKAISKIKRSTHYLKQRTAQGETIYGVNTGFGLFSNVKVSSKDLEKLQANLLRSHAVGTGEALKEDQVRAMMLLRAHNLAQGYSGVRSELILKIIELLNKNIIPYIPEQGSVGASGDLAPLSHLALCLIGEGEVFYDGKRYKTSKVFIKTKTKPIQLGAKEGLALINGTQMMTALGTLTLLDAEYLCSIAHLAGAISLEAMQGTTAAFDPLIQKVRPHQGQIEVAKQMLKLLSPASEIARSHADCDKVQDPYSLRCIPQVHGASLDTLRFVRKTLETEINSVTDNPLVFSESHKVLSGGNFHGQYVAMSMDFLSIAMSELANMSELRIEKLINPALSGLPAFLTENGGLNSGFMIVQVAAASIVSENKTLCHPASVDSIPTSADKEDHVSMGAWAARKATLVVQNVRRVLAMELMAATQGLDFRRPLKSTRSIENARSLIRKFVPFIKEDIQMYPYIHQIEALLKNRKI